MRTQQQTNQKNEKNEFTAENEKNKDKNKDKDKVKEKDKESNYDDEKSSHRGREGGSVEDNNEEYFVNDKNEFQFNENFTFDDNMIVKNKNENENKNGEDVTKNMKNLSNYFKISESELNILCKKISKSKINNESVSTTGGRVRSRDDRGNLLRTCVFNAELSDVIECCLLNEENDIFVIATGKMIFHVFYFFFLLLTSSFILLYSICSHFSLNYVISYHYFIIPYLCKDFFIKRIFHLFCRFIVLLCYCTIVSFSSNCFAPH